MKRMLMLSLAVFAFVASQARPWKMMSYNIRNGRGMDEVVSYQRIADAIMRELPDVVAVQEVDSVTGRSHRHAVLDEIAIRTGMHGTFAPAINYDGGKYGIGILSRTTPLSVKVYPLPGSEEARAILLAEFDHYVFCCTHLSLTDKDRIQSLHLIKDLAKDCNKPFFLAGDFNNELEGTFRQMLLQDFDVISETSSYTFQGEEPKVTIDYIVSLRRTGKKVKVVKRKVLDEPMASDHRPIVVEIK